MKRIGVLLFCFYAGYAFPQTQLPQSNLDDWSVTNGIEEPNGGWWTSLNSLKNLGAPITVTKTADAHSGGFAAKLETKQWGSFLLPGLLVAGVFTTSAPFVIQGRPFTDNPAKFKGWYKYTSVNSDSAAIFAMISKYNVQSGKRDTLAIAKMAVKSSVTDYIQFDLDFDYKIANLKPDSIFVVFSSSVDGGNFQGQVGSTLFVDDLVLEYPSGLTESLSPEVELKVSPSPGSNLLRIEFRSTNKTPIECRIFTMDGRLVERFTPGGSDHVVDVSDFGQGTFILQLWQDSVLCATKKFQIIH